MKKNKIIINTTGDSYPVYFGNNFLSSVGSFVNNEMPNVKKVCIISDKKLPFSLLKKLVEPLKKYYLKIYRVNVTEELKSSKVAFKLI